MKQIIKLQYQSAIDGNRPQDEALHCEEIILNDSSGIPNVGDYVSFDNEIVYKVKTRLFEYSYNDDHSWSINANIVVEKEQDDKYNYLIKM